MTFESIFWVHRGWLKYSHKCKLKNCFLKPLVENKRNVKIIIMSWSGYMTLNTIKKISKNNLDRYNLYQKGIVFEVGHFPPLNNVKVCFIYILNTMNKNYFETKRNAEDISLVVVNMTTWTLTGDFEIVGWLNTILKVWKIVLDGQCLICSWRLSKHNLFIHYREHNIFFLDLSADTFPCEYILGWQFTINT